MTLPTQCLIKGPTMVGPRRKFLYEGFQMAGKGNYRSICHK